MSHTSPRRSRRIILHIGQHKTGSKALQTALYGNREFLAKNGFEYPVRSKIRPLLPYEMNHLECFQTLRALLKNLIITPRSVRKVQNALQRILDLCRQPDSTVILSCEDLFDMHTAHEPQFSRELVSAGATLLARALNNLSADVQVVCYLRRQDHLLAAHYAQFIKGSGQNHQTFAEFQRLFADRLEYDALLASWESAFGLERVTVCPYERTAMPAGIVPDFFERFLGLGPPPCPQPFPDNLEAQNITPSRDHVEYMRYLNQRAARGEKVVGRAQVLTAAFRDQTASAKGISAWLSPAERAELLAHHDSGNRHIALRHRLGEQLFQEPIPRADDRWQPTSAPDLRRLVELDREAHQPIAEQSAWRRWLDRMRNHFFGRQIWWIVPSSVNSADLQLATRLFPQFAGHPTIESHILTALPTSAVPAADEVPCKSQRPAMVFLVGPPLAAPSREVLSVDNSPKHSSSAPADARMSKSATTMILVLGEVPQGESCLQSLGDYAPSLQAIVAPNREIYAELIGKVPKLRSLPFHPAEGD